MESSFYGENIATSYFTPEFHPQGRFSILPTAYGLDVGPSGYGKR